METLSTMRAMTSAGTRCRSAPAMIHDESNAPITSPIPGINPSTASMPRRMRVPGMTNASSIRYANRRSATRSFGSAESGSMTSGM